MVHDLPRATLARSDHHRRRRGGLFFTREWTFYWALKIVLNNGGSVTAERTALSPFTKANTPRLLAAMEQVAARWQIPVQLTPLKAAG